LCGANWFWSNKFFTFFEIKIFQYNYLTFLNLKKTAQQIINIFLQKQFKMEKEKKRDKNRKEDIKRVIGTEIP
jgi:hypothetical protein